MPKNVFVAVDEDGAEHTRTSNHEYIAAVLAKNKDGWGIFSCHETYEAAMKSERQAISWMERGAYKSVALVGMYQRGWIETAMK